MSLWPMTILRYCSTAVLLYCLVGRVSVLSKGHVTIVVWVRLVSCVSCTCSASGDWGRGFGSHLSSLSCPSWTHACPQRLLLPLSENVHLFLSKMQKQKSKECVLIRDVHGLLLLPVGGAPCYCPPPDDAGCVLWSCPSVFVSSRWTQWWVLGHGAFHSEGLPHAMSALCFVNAPLAL